MRELRTVVTVAMQEAANQTKRAEAAEASLAAQTQRIQQVSAEMRTAVESTWDDIDDIDLQVGRWADQLSALTASCRLSGSDQVEDFYRRVNQRAEADMLAGKPVTGAHHRALEAEIARYRATGAETREPAREPQEWRPTTAETVVIRRALMDYIDTNPDGTRWTRRNEHIAAARELFRTMPQVKVGYPPDPPISETP